MSAISGAAFRTMLPEFADTNTYSDSYLASKLAEAWLRINDERFGDLAQQAHAYMTAHLMTMFPPAGLGNNAGGGRIKAFSAGGVAVTFTDGPSDDTLGTTQYGRMFLELADLKPALTYVLPGEWQTPEL